nr:hypothetical protein [Tanacetum cinerariifolium]
QSKKGRLKLVKTADGYRTLTSGDTGFEEAQDELVTVYEWGKMVLFGCDGVAALATTNGSKVPLLYAHCPARNQPARAIASALGAPAVSARAGGNHHGGVEWARRTGPIAHGWRQKHLLSSASTGAAWHLHRGVAAHRADARPSRKPAQAGHQSRGRIRRHEPPGNRPDARQLRVQQRNKVLVRV